MARELAGSTSEWLLYLWLGYNTRQEEHNGKVFALPYSFRAQSSREGMETGTEVAGHIALTVKKQSECWCPTHFHFSQSRVEPRECLCPNVDGSSNPTLRDMPRYLSLC